MFRRFLLSLPDILGQIFYFAFIVVVVGAISFLVGELMPRYNFDYTASPYASYKWEKDGFIYLKLHIQFWKDHVPDMSQYIQRVFRKKITVFRDNDYLERLVQETCVAELVHDVLILISPIFMVLMPGWVGVVATILYILGNIPFILIQRYNRPRLVKLMRRQAQKNQVPGLVRAN